MMAEENRPVAVRSDYTQKPQKPITLKPGIAEERLNAVSWSRPPGEILGTPAEQEAAIPPPAEAPVPVTVQWTLDGISEEVRDEAIESANLEGVPVGEWVDRVLRDVLFEPIPEEPLDEAYEDPDREYAEGAEERYGYEAGEAAAEEMAPIAETRPAVPAEATTEPSTASVELQIVLQEISNRLYALEQRRGFWDVVRGLFGGK